MADKNGQPSAHLEALRRTGGAFGEIADGVSALLSDWERDGDLYGEGGDKIAAWVLRHELFNEAIKEVQSLDGGSIKSV